MRQFSTKRCEGCSKRRPCLYTATGPFRRMWRCLNCEREDEEALIDIVKAALSRLEKEKNDAIIG